MTTVSRPVPPDILSAEHARDPDATYRILLEDYPVLYHEGTNSWIVSRQADVLSLLRHPDVTAANHAVLMEPLHGRTILQMEGREHTAHRRLLNAFFHGGGLERFHAKIESTARDTAAPFLEREAAAVRSGERDRGQVDIVTEFTQIFPVNVILDMFDLPHSDCGRLLQWGGAMHHYLTPPGSQEKIDAGMRARQEISDYVLPVIAERRGGDGDDLISLLCRSDIDGERLNDEDVRAFVSMLILAASENTDHGLASLFSNLLQYPDMLAAVYEDHELIEDALAETLRHTPSVHIVPRQANAAIELQGVVIPAGSMISCLLAAANRDPRAFADPDRFDIYRADNHTDRAFRASADHLSFANGRHFCVGAMLARAEIRVGAELLLDNMKDMRLGDGFDPRGDNVFTDVFTRRPNHVEVSYIPT